MATSVPLRFPLALQDMCSLWFVTIDITKWMSCLKLITDPNVAIHKKILALLHSN